MAKEEEIDESGFMSRLEDFFVFDERSRWRAIGWTIAATGTVGSVELVFNKASVDDAVISMTIVTTLMFIGWIAWYCSFKQRREIGVSLSRRRLLIQATAGLFGVFIGTGVSRAQRKTSERILERVSANPANPQNSQEAVTLLTRAQAAQVRISPAVLEKTGKQFVNAAQESPEAWEASLEFLKYKTYTNSFTAGFLVNMPPNVSGGTTYVFDALTNLPPPKFSSLGGVPKELAAQFMHIGEDPDKGKKWGVSLLKVEGGGLILDGMQLRNVLIYNALIVYRGGPLILKNVYFVSCTFDMDQNRNTRGFIAAALGDPSVSVTFSGL
jgi:hypothetical protein